MHGMPISREKKEAVVKDLQEKIQKAEGIVFAKFHGLSVAKISQFRRTIRACEGEYTVAKKTLIGIAFKNAGKEIAEVFPGEVAVLTGHGDGLALFKTAVDFAKKEKEAFQVLGGYFEGKFVDAATARALGSIPSREILIAQLMNVILGNTRILVYMVDQLSKSRRETVGTPTLDS